MDNNSERVIIRSERKKTKQNGKKKKIIISAACVVLAAIIGLFAYLIPFRFVAPSPDKMKTFDNVGDGQALRVGVISDTQLKPKNVIEGEENGVNNNAENLKKTLQLLKAQKVDMIIHAGDIADVNNKYSYEVYNSVIDEVYPDKKNRPIFFNIMGNHDLWSTNGDNNTVSKYRLFKSQTGQSPWIHYKVNGFHFIGASPDLLENTRGYSEKTIEWLKQEIEAAIADSKPGNPVFVITHHNVNNTVYGSELWSDPNLTTLLSQYESVVSISGHSHFSILDERSINQKNLTTFTTQSIAYVELEYGKFDAFKDGESIHPPYSDNYPMCLIMNVGEKNTTIERWNVVKNREEKDNMRWTLNYPLEKGTFTYRNDVRQSKAQAPSFTQNAKLEYKPYIKSYLDETKSLPGIAFTAAVDDDFVHSYNVRLTDVNTGKMYTYLYFSDFTRGISDMAKTVEIALDKNLPSARYKVEVYAVDSFNLYSETAVTGEIDWVKPAVE